MTLPELLLLTLTFAAMLAYGILGGADFGSGIWDLLARGPRASEQRSAIAAAIGPVWEANHVWLIFLVVLLFSGFPLAFSALVTALFWPLHVALAGIVLRGSAFVFRAYGRAPEGLPDVWPHLFGVASVLTPFAFGAALATLAAGGIRADGVGGLAAGSDVAWLRPFPIVTGLLAVALCAYLAAVYLTLETAGEVRRDFRRRALGAWLVAGGLSLATLALAPAEAPRFLQSLLQPPALLLAAVGTLLAPASGYALARSAYKPARLLAAAQVGLLLASWAAAQYPYIIYPDHSVSTSAAPPATITALLWTTPFGFAVLIPSLVVLFAVFKGERRGH